jgi:ABC-type nitrate/sulfonate/bicarbonate transport system permease component
MSVATAQQRVHAPRPPTRSLTSYLSPGTIGLIAGALAWEIIGQVANASFFPPLSAVLVRLVELTLDGQIVANLASSLLNLTIGFTFSVVFGVLIGMAMGAYRKVEMALDFYVFALLTAPTLVLAPLFFSIFGSSNPRPTIVGVIILYVIFIIIVNTTAAIRSVPAPLVEMGRAYCANERQLFRKIILPAATPLIMAGIRLGMGRGVKGMINGEMFIAIVGLGAVVKKAGIRFDSEAVLAVLILIIVVAMILTKIVQLIDQRLTGWLPSNARQRKRT